MHRSKAATYSYEYCTVLCTGQKSTIDKGDLSEPDINYFTLEQEQWDRRREAREHFDRRIFGTSEMRFVGSITGTYGERETTREQMEQQIHGGHIAPRVHSEDIETRGGLAREDRPLLLPRRFGHFACLSLVLQF